MSAKGRTRHEIAVAANQMQQAAEYGRAIGDTRDVPRWLGMAKLAEALAWAAGEDNDFTVVLAELHAIDRRKKKGAQN